MQGVLKLFDTFTKTEREFVPTNQGKVTIYLCGMTVQDKPHLGHVRAFLMGDVLRRYLEFKGFQTIYVQNFTDIDDKIIDKSQRLGVDWRKLAEDNISKYTEVAKELNFKTPYLMPRATIHIQEIIEWIETLMKKGFAYQTPDNSVYFDVTKFEGYGKLSGKKFQNLEEYHRIEPSKYKRSPLDFALWKGKKENEPYWHSPFGRGRPGWHIECSVMSTLYLGQPIDIHGGGVDLIFPHHENEIAQSEAYADRKFVNYWFHVGFVQLGGEKMSKSTGILTYVDEILDRYIPDVVRFYLLSSHYRSNVEYSEDGLESAKNGFNRFLNFLETVESKDLSFQDFIVNPITRDYLNRFEKAMDDDLNTPKALGIIFNMVKEGYSSLEKGDLEKAYIIRQNVEFLLKVLGFKLELKKRTGAFLDELIDFVIEIRQILRSEKRFDLSDKIRDFLTSKGIIVEDKTDGKSTWRWRR